MATKWGVAAAGNVSADFVASLSDKSDTHKVVAVAARKEDRAREFATKFGISRWYGSYEKLATDDDVDVIYIGAINPAHLELCELYIEAGKNVVCEKPLGMNVKETEIILAKAKAKNVFFMEAIWTQFIPAVVKLKEELKKHAIGEVKNAMITFGVVSDAERILKKSLGGGVTLDFGIYPIFMSQLLMGWDFPNKIVACGHLNDDGVDESISACLSYENGKTATISASCRVSLPCEATVYGTEGEITLKYPFWCTTTIVTPEGTFDYPVAPDPKCHKYVFMNSANFIYEADHVRDCLLKGLKESPELPHQLTLNLAKIMESVRTQAGVVYPQDS